MYETILQQTTGVKLYQEEEKFLTSKEYEQLSDKMDTFAYSLQAESNINKSHICEIYFDSPIAEEEKQAEQFLITIEKKGNNKTFTLKRRNFIGMFRSEASAKLSKKQYREILKGSFEWMKSSGKLLVNEFYHKLKLFEYRIGTVITCLRQELFIQAEMLQVTVDRSIQKLYGSDEITGMVAHHTKPAYVRVRCAKTNQGHNQTLLEEWLR